MFKLFGKKKDESPIKKKKPDLIPGSPVFRYLRDECGLDGDTLLRLRRVEIEDSTGEKTVNKVRVFDPAKASKKEVSVEDYDSLDAYPDLVLYEGYYIKDSGETEIVLNKAG